MQIFIWRWGAGGHIFSNLKSMPSWIPLKTFLPLVKPKNETIFVNIRKCYKSHAASFNVFYNSISTNLDGAKESLALYKWCYQCQKLILPLTVLLIGVANW
jgi:hypothetical protein